MATRFDSFNVSPSVSGLPAMTVPPVENAGPKQLIQAGQAIQSASSDAQQIFMDQLKEANALAVNEAVTSTKEWLLDATYGENGFTRIKGYDALHRPDNKSLAEEYETQFREQSDTIRAGLRNDAQRREFDKLADGMGLSFSENLVKHTAGERHNWFVSNVKGSIAVGQREIALSAGDPEATEGAVARVKAQVATLGTELGMSAAEIEAEQYKMLGEAHKLAIGGLISDGRWEAASTYFDRHRDEMDADSQFAVNTAIDKEADFAIGSAVGRDSVLGATAEAKASAPQQLITPVKGDFPISSGLGMRGGRMHKGVDISTPVGTKVAAPADGVARIKNDPDGYGQYVVIDHGGGLETRMAHLSGIDVKDGDVVRQGQIIARSGGARGAQGAGNSRGPHLHYEVRQDGKPVDPSGAYRTKGRAQSPTSSLTEALRRAREDPRIGSDPHRLQIAEQAIKEQFQARDYDERQSEEDAQNAAYTWVSQNPGKPISAMPAGIRNAVEGKDLPSLYAFQKSTTEALTGAGVTAEASAGTYGAVRDAIGTSIKSVSDLVRFRPYLTASDYKQLVDDVVAVNKGDQGKIDSLKSTQDALGLLKSEITAMGIDPKDDDEEYVKLRGAAYREIERAERAAGRPLTGDEKRPIVLTLLGKTSVSSGGVGGLFGGEKKGYEIDNARRVMPYSSIPASIRDNITASLRRRGVPADKISRQMVVDEYYKFSRSAP